MAVISGVEDLKKTVVYLFSGEVSGDRLTSVHPLGTAFIVAIPHQEVEHAVWPYLVTAKHVLKSNAQYSTQVFVRANLREWSPTSSQIGATFIPVRVLDSEGNLTWSIHPDPAVDLAVIQAGPPSESYEVKYIPPTMFAVEEVIQREGVAEGDEIFFPCFTPEIPQRRRNYPVIRFGRIALVSPESISTREGRARFHFAECFPFGGNSGSPVFLRFGPMRKAGIITAGERYFLLGVMKGYWAHEQTVGIRRTEFHLSVEQSIGIATIIPVDYLNDIVYSDTLRRQRGEID